MAINGSDLLARLQSMVKVEQQRKQRAFASTFGNVVRARMFELGRGELAGEAFDEIRKWKRDEQLIRNEVPNVGEKARRNMPHAIPEETLRIVYNENIDLFETLQSELNSLRSKTTHVSAVFRPFKPKYFDVWADAVQDFPKFKLLDKAGDLHIRPVTDLISFKIWADDVYSLFSESAVYDPTVMSLKNADTGANRIPLPMGMIRKGSERIYGQQWRLWIRENQEEIAEYIESTPPESRRKVEAISTSTSMAEYLGRQNTDVNELETPSLPYKPGHVSEIELVVAPINDASLAASQTWSSRAAAIEAIGEFIDALRDAWGLDHEQVRCTFKFGNGVVPVKPLTLSEAAGFLKGFLEKRA